MSSPATAATTPRPAVGPRFPNPHGALSIPFWLSLTGLASVFSLIRLSLVILLPLDRAHGLFDDDAFFYFGVARNIAAGAGSTFNGVDLTNGYHPLWMAVLVPLFAAFSGRSVLVAVVVVSTACFLVSARLLDLLARRSGHPAAATLCALPLLVAGATGPSFWFSGMETGLLLLGLLTLAWVSARPGGALDPAGSRRAALLAGVVMAATVLARLDAVFPLLAVGTLMVVRWRRRPLREVLLLVATVAVVPALVLIGYLTASRRLFGTPLPVSGQAKALGGGPRAADLVQFLQAPVLFGQELWLGALAVVVAPLAVLVGRHYSSALPAFGLAVLTGGLLTVVYYSLTSSWRLWPWYFYAAPLALALCGPVLAARIPLTRGWRPLLAAALALAVLMVAGKAAIVWRGGGEAEFVVRSPEVAAAVTALAPPGTAVAMGDRAGSFGYELGRPLVHLEGLVGPANYLPALDRGDVGPFLASHRVSVYVRADNDAGTPDPAAGPGCRRYPEPEQGAGPKAPVIACDPDLLLTVPLDDASYRVWRYRPELNS